MFLAAFPRGLQLRSAVSPRDRPRVSHARRSHTLGPRRWRGCYAHGCLSPRGLAGRGWAGRPRLRACDACDACNACGNPCRGDRRVSPDCRLSPGPARDWAVAPWAWVPGCPRVALGRAAAHCPVPRGSHFRIMLAPTASGIALLGPALSGGGLSQTRCLQVWPRLAHLCQQRTGMTHVCFSASRAGAQVECAACDSSVPRNFESCFPRTDTDLRMRHLPCPAPGWAIWPRRIPGEHGIRVCTSGLMGRGLEPMHRRVTARTAHAAAPARQHRAHRRVPTGVAWCVCSSHSQLELTMRGSAARLKRVNALPGRVSLAANSREHGAAFSGTRGWDG